MNLRTTLALLVLGITGVAVWRIGPALPFRGKPDPAASADAGTLALLEEKLKPERVKEVHILRGKDELLSFKRGAKGGWTMPGGWPTRDSEVNALVERLCSLRSRFAPTPLGDAKKDLARFGLETPELTVIVKAAGIDYHLDLGEEGGAKNRFYNPTWARLTIDEKGYPEVVRLSPGLIGELTRPRDFYQQRRLFPVAREPRSADQPELVDFVQADGFTVETTGKDGSRFSLGKDSRGWHLTAPTVDRIDPEKAATLREVVADIWAERFVSLSPADVAAAVGGAGLTDVGLAAPLTALEWTTLASSREGLLARTGLREPERKLTVRHSGGTSTLLIGEISGTKLKPAPPPRDPRMPPPPPEREEFRYARLENNDQIFEIKADRLKDLFVATTGLRDTKLTRVKKENVRTIEVTQGGEKLVLRRDPGKEEKWKVEMTGDKSAIPAQTDKVNELLDKLTGLTAQDTDRDGPALGVTAIGMLGSPVFQPLLSASSLYPGRVRGVAGETVFRKPLAVVKLTLRPETEGVNEKPGELTLTIGEHDTQHKLLLVRVDDWKRVEAVEDAAWPIVKRPALAYRGKLFDFGIPDVVKLVVDHNGKTLALTQSGDKWKLTDPADADADAMKVTQLLGQLTKLEPTEYLAENPTATDLDKQYGLTKPTLTVTVQTAGQLKRLRIGKQREGKQESFAQLDGSSNVFTVSADLRVSLEADALSYLPLQLWRIEPTALGTIRIEKEGAKPFTLEQKDGMWKVAAPVAAAALEPATKALGDVVGNPFAERYETLTIKDPREYGFDKPFLKVAVTGAEAKHELIVGKPVKDGPDRFAKRGDSSAVFVLRGDVVAGLDRGVLDLVDTLLLSVDLSNVKSVRSQVGEAKLRLEPDGKGWKALDATPMPFTADENAVAALGEKLFNLRAQKYAAYGADLDLMKHGLAKPFATLELSIQEEGKKRTAVLAIGAEVKDRPGQRYARLDNGPGIAILPPLDTKVLTRTYLDYVDHKVLALVPEQVTNVQRKQGMQTLEIAKQDGKWTLKPSNQDGDERAVDGLLALATNLRAESVAEYPLKDAKKFGLDMPFAVVTFKRGGGQNVLTLGSEVADKPGRRYATADGGKTAFVLGPAAVKVLEAPAISFRNRALASFPDAEKIQLERGPRRATFSRVAGSWTMTAPVEAKVDNDQVEEFLGKAAKLEADELVAEKPADLKPYGLDKPTARWRFQQDGKDVLDLVLGKREGKRCYATLGKDGLVFLLSADLTARAMGEFRDRTVWTMPIDAAQVDVLQLTRDGKTLTLKKDGNVWTCLEKPKTPLNGETVNDTLSALAGLKLERYAADGKADKKLFGLEPPALIVEAEAGDKKVVLHIGTLEGGSKQAYASVPEKDRTDVFVLSEADTARLMRDLEGFGKSLPKEPKPAGGIQ